MDLIELAASLRNTGMSLASDAQDRAVPQWSEMAYQTIVTLATRHRTLHVDQVLTAFPYKPGHPNAWGAVWMRAIKAGVIERTGQIAPCTVDPGKHKHNYPVYRSLVYRGIE